MITVLVLDDQQIQIEAICRGLFLYGYNHVSASSIEETITTLESKDGKNINVVLAELSLIGKSGLDVIRNIKKLRYDVKLIAIHGLKPTPSYLAAKAMGIPILQKPYDPDKLDCAIKQLFPPTLEMAEGHND